MLLNLLNSCSLIVALFTKIKNINGNLKAMRSCNTSDPAKSYDLPFPGNTTTTAPIAEATAIYGILHAAINDLFPNILPKVATTAATVIGTNIKYAKRCVPVPVNCSKTSTKSTTTSSLLTTLIATSFATTILPEINSQLSTMEYSSTTTSTYTDMDFNYISTVFDGTTDNENVVTDANSIYPMDSTTALPFDAVMNYDYEATTPTPHYDDNIDEYTDYDDNGGGDGDGKFVIVLAIFFTFKLHV